jgi:hypothetical protein
MMIITKIIEKIFRLSVWQEKVGLPALSLKRNLDNLAVGLDFLIDTCLE